MITCSTGVAAGDAIKGRDAANEAKRALPSGGGGTAISHGRQNDETACRTPLLSVAVGMNTPAAALEPGRGGTGPSAPPRTKQQPRASPPTSAFDADPPALARGDSPATPLPKLTAGDQSPRGATPSTPSPRQPEENGKTAGHRSTRRVPGSGGLLPTVKRRPQGQAKGICSDWNPGCSEGGVVPAALPLPPACSPSSPCHGLPPHRCSTTPSLSGPSPSQRAGVTTEPGNLGPASAPNLLPSLAGVASPTRQSPGGLSGCQVASRARIGLAELSAVRSPKSAGELSESPVDWVETDDLEAAIHAREGAVHAIKALLASVRHVRGTHPLPEPLAHRARVRLARLLARLRAHTTEVVEHIERWRHREERHEITRAHFVKPEPYLWMGRNYLLKLAGDLPFAPLLPLLQVPRHFRDASETLPIPETLGSHEFSRATSMLTKAARHLRHLRHQPHPASRLERSACLAGPSAPSMVPRRECDPAS